MSQFPSHWHVSQAVRCFRAGGILAYPTEAVFGLGCDPANPDSVLQLLALKQRNIHKGLILVAASIQQLQRWIAPLPRKQERQLSNSWPGPHTWVLPAADHCPDWLTGGRDTLAVRVSAHPVVQQLCQSTGQAIVSTSANRSSGSPARSMIQIRLRFPTGIDYYLPGALGRLKQPTRIRDLQTGHVIR
ncbi:Threonylcarbamoyl-AMP synthase [hydrothermal vent metagenome]|uniref:L-threonylcarbamoyladenylate synthase n=1 Tax=hydrothermal vent metagenome TaxID=652676 RepID=A0A3B0Z302_9ZZZZ